MLDIAMVHKIRSLKMKNFESFFFQIFQAGCPQTTLDWLCKSFVLLCSPKARPPPSNPNLAGGLLTRAVNSSCVWKILRWTHLLWTNSIKDFSFVKVARHKRRTCTHNTIALKDLRMDFACTSPSASAAFPRSSFQVFTPKSEKQK